MIKLTSLKIITLLFFIVSSTIAKHTTSTKDTTLNDKASTEVTILPPMGSDRGRVQIHPTHKTPITDNGRPLRGEHLRIANLPDGLGGTELDRAYDLTVWQEMVESFHLNAVRLLLYRPPQNWPGGPGNNCPVERCFASVNDAIPHIDAMVNIASSMGMYVIIDYHPVGGSNRDDAIAWWNALAPRYKDRTHVLYEISNEPVAWFPINYQENDVAFQEDLYQLIRGHAPNTHIILWTFPNAVEGMLSKIQEANGISYTNASVGFHPYERTASAVDALRDAGYPVINTEIGSLLADDAAAYDEYANRTAVEENANISWIWLDGTGLGKDWDEPLPVTWSKDPATGLNLPPAAYLPSFVVR